MKLISVGLGLFVIGPALATLAIMQVYAYPYYDQDCAYQMFNKYLNDAKPEFDKYMDKASNLYDSLSPSSESEVNTYIDQLNPLAQNYVDNLEPYAQKYVDDLGNCMR